MSSLVTAPRGATPEPAGGTRVSRTRGLAPTVDAALSVVLAACFAAIVFVATGGTDLAPNTWVEVALIAVAAGAGIALLVVRPSGRTAAVPAFVLFAALAALTYASIAWSVQPANSWVEANRTLSYLAAFAAAVALARLAPGRWRALVGGVAIVAVVVSGYALLAKVFPASLNAGDPLGRLRVPFGYWNATGLVAALGLPCCLWAGARPKAGRAFRTAAVPALAILFTVLMLSYSRGGLVAAAVGLACWFAFVPFRLRATLLLALGAIGGAVATAWALKHHAITHDYASLSARTSAGHTFGIVLVVVLVLVTLAGLGAAVAMERVPLSTGIRRRIGTALLVLVAMVPVVAVGAVAASSRGLTGEISHVWNTVTSPNSHVSNNPGRVAQLGSSRPLYWSEGLKVGEHAVLKGVGAVGFDTARTRYTTNPLLVGHAHSYVVETFADFGLIGLAVTLALLAAWGVAVRRTLWPGRHGRADRSIAARAASPPADAPGTSWQPSASAPAPVDATLAAERAGLLTLFAVVVIFGVSSLIDWTWFVPGVAVPALACAGWLAGRGPLTSTPDRTGPRGPTDAERSEAHARPSLSPGAAAATIATVAAALIAAWFVWQPLHSTDSFNAAISAIGRGDAQLALADARAAASSDPVSVDPLWEESSIYSALGDDAAARTELVKATSLQPDNPQTWEQLGLFDLQRHRYRLALSELQTAHRLDLGSTAIAQQVAQAQKAL